MSAFAFEDRNISVELRGKTMVRIAIIVLLVVLVVFLS